MQHLDLSPRRALLLTLLGAALALACGGGGGGGGGDGGGLFDDDDEVVRADMSNGVGSVNTLTLRGRLIQDEPEDLDDPDVNPSELISQDELKNADVTFALQDGATAHELGGAKTDGEGYIEVELDLGPLSLAPGRYTIHVSHADQRVGEAKVVLLDEDHTDPVVRSDIDLTYLNTDFMSSTGLAELLIQSAPERETLPAMERVYQGLRGDDDRPLTFLSGSPRFFKRVLENKAKLDGVEQEGIVLKPFDEIIGDNILDLDPQEIVPELKEQVGYKLSRLLRLRLEIPLITPEILLGDDSEADFITYNLYARLLSGDLDLVGLEAELDALGVVEDWLSQIRPLAEMVTVLGPPEVQAIYINLTGHANPDHPVDDWAIPGLTRFHVGAWPLILDLWEQGWVQEADVTAVRARLTTLGQSDGQLSQAAQDADFLDPDTLARFP